jgi:predicted Holliday junction resolvase-like endonuclease
MNSLFEEFSELRKILCICPCCGEIVRVSDLHLKVKKPVTKTWLDSYESKIIEMNKKEEKFDEKEQKIRDAAVERGRNEAKKIVNNVVLPIFRTLKLNPFDVKPILSPVDFLVFDGMTEKDKIKDIIFLSRISKIESMNTIRKQIKDVISNKSYTWQVGRIDDLGSLTFEE